jgi:hypothetical protein
MIRTLVETSHLPSHRGRHQSAGKSRSLLKVSETAAAPVQSLFPAGCWQASRREIVLIVVWLRLLLQSS